MSTKQYLAAEQTYTDDGERDYPIIHEFASRRVRDAFVAEAEAAAKADRDRAIRDHEYRTATFQSFPGDALLAYADVPPNRWRVTRRDAESIRARGW